MKLAIAQTCESGHQYYRESGTETPCPYCLIRDAQMLRHKLHRLKTAVNIAYGELNAHDQQAPK